MTQPCPDDVDVTIPANIEINVQTSPVQVVVNTSTGPDLLVGVPSEIVVEAAPSSTLIAVESPSTSTTEVGLTAVEVSIGTPPPIVVDVNLAAPGAPGPPGPPGPSGTDVPFIFDQVSPSSLWHIVHNRGSKPSVVVIRDDGVTIGAFGTDYADNNTVDLYFGSLYRGEATLNF